MTRRHRYRQPDPFVGLSLIGQVQTSKAHLVRCLGEPTACYADIPAGFQRQSLYVWEIRTSSGPVLIFDYKHWEDPDFPEEKVLPWSVVSRAEAYTGRKVHPVNKWLAEQTGLPVTDRRPPHCRPVVVTP